MGLLTILLALGSGINADDEYQNDYAVKLYDYYSSFGQDTSALFVEKGNMHYYGGLFDLVTEVVNRALGNDYNDASYHAVRHVFNALFGVLVLLFTGLLARELGGWRTGILALLLLFLSPRFLGHAMMNPKDIPFAAGNIMALYFLLRWLKDLPRLHWPTLLGLAGGIAIAVSTRAGGLLLFGYMGLFAGLHFLQTAGFKGLFSQPKLLGRYVASGLGIALAGYALAVLFWPYALQNPIANPLKALSEFSQLGIKIRVQFAGDNIMSDQTPWHYPLTWILRTVPLFILLGLPLIALFYRRMLQQHYALGIHLLAFAAAFPLVYIIYKNSLLHDGWRHVLFIYPPLVALTALAWRQTELWVGERRNLRYALWAVLGLSMLEPAVFILRNTAYPYVYFNPAAGGMKGAYGQYETDYWGTSVRQALQWMEKEGLIGENMTDTVRIASNNSYNLGRHIGKRYGGKVKTTYVRYAQRHDQPWDYAIFTSRYVRGPQLRNGIWPPPSQTLHQVTANGVPLAVVLQDKEGHGYRAQQAAKTGDWLTAEAEYLKDKELHPDSEMPWLGLANVYLNTQRPTQALEAAREALKIVPDNLGGLFYEGLALLNTGNAVGAENTFRRAILIDDEYSTAYYYLALIEQERGDLAGALNSIETCIRLNPRFRQAYEQAARIHELMGNAQQAAAYRNAATQVQ
jgi:tetratricopeptide (TPR) repeat protein